MDKLGADFEFSFNTIIEASGRNPIAVQIPIGAGNEFEGIIDLLEMKAYYFDADELGASVEKEIPDACRRRPNEWRHDLSRRRSSSTTHLMEKYLEDENSITPRRDRAALRKGTIARKCNPVFCGRP
jgi:elongation factor G